MPSCDFFGGREYCTCPDCNRDTREAEEARRIYLDEMKKHCSRCKIKLNSDEELFCKDCYYCGTKKCSKKLDTYKIGIVNYCDKCKIDIDNQNKRWLENEQKQKEMDEMKERVQNDKITLFKNQCEYVDICLYPLSKVETFDNEKHHKILLNMAVFDIQKIKNRWYLNKTKYDIFIQNGLNEFSYIEDPRKIRKVNNTPIITKIQRS